MYNAKGIPDDDMRNKQKPFNNQNLQNLTVSVSPRVLDTYSASSATSVSLSAISHFHLSTEVITFEKFNNQ
jgi:hypothetical protein